MADHNVDWEACADDDCVGVRLPTGGKCWAHADDSDLDAAFKRLGRDGRLDARGVPITAELLDRLLAAAPQDEHGHRVLTDARFDGATFQGDARFGGVTFQRDARFGSATFQGGARFSSATFQGGAWFGEVTFQRGTGFDGVTFQHDAWFRTATFKGSAGFGGVTFQHDARFAEVTFERGAGFIGATFQGDARFGGATFQGDARFGGATFQRDARFGRVTFQRDARFGGATFQQARQLGPMLVRKSLLLDQAVFQERAQIDVSAVAVCCRRARFQAGVQLRVRWAQVALDDADLAAPSILTRVPAFRGLNEGRLVRVLERLRAADTRGGQPRLVSLRRADVAGLTVAGVDLQACRFAGAHHLDQLRVEEADFGYTPTGWRWTTRQTIAEEHHWHAYGEPPATSTPNGHDTAATDTPSREAREADGAAGWYRATYRPPAWLEVERLSAAQIAALYRALRKGREDDKDEPGAADFYYGEMEMRRHAKRAQVHREYRHDHRGAATAAATEYVILWLYWLISGYGLRAWRALATLAVVVVLAGGVFAFWGFAPPAEPSIRPVAVDVRGAPIYARQPVRRPAGLDELPTAIRFSAQAATALLRGPDRPLTALGEWLHMALRLVGPVLLGLAVLSIRGRVRR